MTHAEKFDHSLSIFTASHQLHLLNACVICKIFRSTLKVFYFLYLEHQKAVSFFPLNVGQTYFALSRNNQPNIFLVIQVINHLGI